MFKICLGILLILLVCLCFTDSTQARPRLFGVGCAGGSCSGENASVHVYVPATDAPQPPVGVYSANCSGSNSNTSSYRGDSLARGRVFNGRIRGALRGLLSRGC